MALTLQDQLPHKADNDHFVLHDVGVVEEGRIYFLYRPRVNVDHPTSIDDIQRFFMILAPSSRPKVLPPV